MKRIIEAIKNTARGQDKIDSEKRREEAWRERRGEGRAREQR